MTSSLTYNSATEPNNLAGLCQSNMVAGDKSGHALLISLRLFQFALDMVEVSEGIQITNRQYEQYH